MRILATILWLLSGQFVLGTAVIGSVAALHGSRPGRGSLGRRRRAKWGRGARALLPVLPVALTITLLGLLIPAGRSSLPPRAAGMVATGSLASAGCFLLYRAGLLERRGLRLATRQQSRLGGDATSLGALLLLVWSALPGLAAARATDLLGFSALFACAAVGLLAGWSGKPRPSGRLAALLYVAGLSLLVVGISGAGT